MMNLSSYVVVVGGVVLCVFCVVVVAYLHNRTQMFNNIVFKIILTTTATTTFRQRCALQALYKKRGSSDPLYEDDNVNEEVERDLWLSVLEMSILKSLHELESIEQVWFGTVDGQKLNTRDFSTLRFGCSNNNNRNFHWQNAWPKWKLFAINKRRGRNKKGQRRKKLKQRYVIAATAQRLKDSLWNTLFHLAKTKLPPTICNNICLCQTNQIVPSGEATLQTKATRREEARQGVFRPSWIQPTYSVEEAAEIEMKFAAKPTPPQPVANSKCTFFFRSLTLMGCHHDSRLLSKLASFR